MKYRIEIVRPNEDAHVSVIEIADTRYDAGDCRFRAKTQRELEGDIRRRVTMIQKRYPEAQVNWREVES